MLTVGRDARIRDAKPRHEALRTQRKAFAATAQRERAESPFTIARAIRLRHNGKELMFRLIKSER
jgi:hypothetical protein